MNRELIFRKIGVIISEISEQYGYLSADPEKINPLELELFIANSHFLSEHLVILKKMDESQTLLINQPLIQLSEQNKLIPLVKQSIIKTGTMEVPDGASAAENITEAENLKMRDAQESPQIKVNISEEFVLPVNEFIQTEPEIQKIDPAREFVIDTIKIEKSEEIEINQKIPTLNETLSAGLKNQDLVFKNTSIAVKDLKSMIKLNDKLLFVRDLFNGYSLAYSEAIDLLNRYDNFETADNFLKQNYAVKNKWDEKQSTVEYFYEILNKRFN
ncbi:MAG: hypothetical protein H7096_06055 [Flavobacterium sp.]|nr:hypothetical protein [Pedobacter sp.]